jgi:hypothetical protein
MLRRHPGQWLLAFDHANHAAAQFWPATVAAIADGPVESCDRYPPEAAIPGTEDRRPGALPPGEGRIRSLSAPASPARREGLEALYAAALAQVRTPHNRLTRLNQRLALVERTVLPAGG